MLTALFPWVIIAKLALLASHRLVSTLSPLLTFVVCVPVRGGYDLWCQFTHQLAVCSLEYGVGSSFIHILFSLSLHSKSKFAGRIISF